MMLIERNLKDYLYESTHNNDFTIEEMVEDIIGMFEECNRINYKNVVEDLIENLSVNFYCSDSRAYDCIGECNECDFYRMPITDFKGVVERCFEKLKR